MSTNQILAAGLDAGSAHTRCVIALLEGERFRFLGYGHAPSAGWSKGKITDQAAASACWIQFETTRMRNPAGTVPKSRSGMRSISSRGWSVSSRCCRARRSSRRFGF